MSVVIVCRPRIVRDLLNELFGRLPQGVRQACEQAGQLGAVEPGDILLVYGTGSLQDQLGELQAVRHRDARAPVVLVGSALGPEDVEFLRLAGANAVMSDDNPASSLVGVVCMVQAGFGFVGEEPIPVPAILPRPRADAEPGAPTETRNGAHPLSPQEIRILTRLMGGHSNKDIASELGITEATVKVHLRACYEKIGARNRTQAAMWAAAHFPRPA